MKKYNLSHFSQLNLILTTADNFLAANVYVAYRSQHPDKETVDRAEKKLKDNDINDSQLVDWPADNCQ
jgi:hypothetical protein